MSKHIETVQRIYQAFGAGDVATILTHLAKDVAWDQDAPSYGVAIYEPGSGHEHVLRFFQALGAVEFLRFEPKNFLSGGAQVAVPVEYEMRVRATGEVLKGLEIHLWTFDESGQVSRFFHSVDRHAFVLALGPKPAV